MIVGGYSLDLYCDITPCAGVARWEVSGRYGRFYDENNFKGAKREARIAGWYFHEKDTKVKCPVCAKKAGHKPLKNNNVETAASVSIFELGKDTI